MADRPIIFSAPMVRAILAGRKTQTRRVVRLPQWAVEISDIGDDGYTLWCVSRESGSIVPALPQYLPHDRLWVREAWSGHHVFRNTPPSQRSSFVGEGQPYLHDEIWYWADGSPEYGDWEKPRSSIHMPRKLSRLTLVVTDVRVQRVQEISEVDAEAEGARPAFTYPGWDGVSNVPRYRWGFHEIWNSIHGSGAWNENPWVAAISFETHRCNIDQMEDA